MATIIKRQKIKDGMRYSNLDMIRLIKLTINKLNFIDHEIPLELKKFFEQEK